MCLALIITIWMWLFSTNIVIFRWYQNIDMTQVCLQVESGRQFSLPSPIPMPQSYPQLCGWQSVVASHSLCPISRGLYTYSPGKPSFHHSCGPSQTSPSSPLSSLNVKSQHLETRSILDTLWPHLAGSQKHCLLSNQ